MTSFFKVGPKRGNRHLMQELLLQHYTLYALGARASRSMALQSRRVQGSLQSAPSRQRAGAFLILSEALLLGVRISK